MTGSKTQQRRKCTAKVARFERLTAEDRHYVSFFRKRRHDLEIYGLEVVWPELLMKSKKVLVAGIYRQPKSNLPYMDLLKENVDLAYNTNIISIIINNDFNFNLALNKDNKITELMHEFNLNQLITDSTHFTEHFSSTIDLVLIGNTANSLHSGLIDPFIPDQIRYHCPSHRC